MEVSRAKRAFNSITKRILALFLCIILPLCIIVILLINTLNVNYQNKIIDTLYKDIESYFEKLESEMTTIINLQLTIMYSTSLFDLTLIPDRLTQIEKMEIFKQLNGKFSMIVSADKYVESITAHIPMINKTIATKGSLTILQEKEVKKLKALGGLSPYRLSYSYNSMHICMQYPAYVNEMNGEPASYLVVELSTDKIKSDIYNMIGDYKGIYFINDLKTGSVIMCSSLKYINLNRNGFSEIKRYGKNGLSPYGTGKLERVARDRNGDIVITAKSEFMNIVAVFIIPRKPIVLLNRYYLAFLYFMLIASPVIVCFAVIYIERLIKRPVSKMIESFERINEGNFDVTINYNERDSFRYLYEKFNFMTDKIRYLINEVYKKQMLAERARFIQLQSQIKPHFLYNNLFVLYRMAKMEECDEIARFALELGNYYKYIAQGDDREVPLKKEFEHARRYVEIQKIKYCERIVVTFEDIPESCLNIPVPPLILQPLVENAYKHAFYDTDISGLIAIQTTVKDDLVRISIDDNGRGMSECVYEKILNKLDGKDDEVESNGILNVHRRIRHSFGSKSGLSFGKSELGGLKVELSFYRKDDFIAAHDDCG